MTVKAKVDIKILEFMLDLPQSFVIKDVSLDNDSVILTIDTSDETPSEFSLVYGSDEFGNVALTGFDEVAND
jgi:hypothetical protein